MLSAFISKLLRSRKPVHYVIVTRGCGKPQEANVMGGLHAGRPNIVPGRRASFNTGASKIKSASTSITFAVMSARLASSLANGPQATHGDRGAGIGHPVGAIQDILSLACGCGFDALAMAQRLRHPSITRIIAFSSSRKSRSSFPYRLELPVFDPRPYHGRRTSRLLSRHSQPWEELYL
jgi:hypothetical protein